MSVDPREMMAVVAARAVRDDDVCFVGIGVPSTACNLARLTHAPNVSLVYESGTIGARPDVLPLSIGDGALCTSAVATVSVPEMFAYWLQSGRFTLGFLGGAQVDRFGNINSTVIGPYDRPRVRLPGAGGAPEIAAACQRTCVVMAQRPQAFVPRVDFVTSLGHGTGGSSRADAGITTDGVSLVVTDLCLLAPDPETKELVVTSLHPGVEASEVRAATGWPVRFARHVAVTPMPDPSELEALRSLEQRTARARARGHG